MRAHKHFLFLLFGVLAGVILARFASISLAFVWLAIFVMCVLALRFKKLVYLVACMAGFGLGVWRAQPILNKQTDFVSAIGQKVQFEATVANDPVYHESGQHQFNVSDVVFEGREMPVTVRVRGFGDVRRGDRLLLRGKLYSGFAYWQASMHFAEIEIVSKDESLSAAFRRDFAASIYSSIPDPEASLGLGLLVGIRSLLPDELMTNLSASGLTHIVAVSGYNLTILVNLARRLLEKRSRLQAVVFSGLFLCIFVSITGWSPSLLRAFIISVTSLACWFYGRSPTAITLLLISSTISAFINPNYAWYEVGWYLSLAAFAGILVLAPAIEERISRGKELKPLSKLMIETFSAQICTLPILLLVFGATSPVALLANMLILPLVPLCMLAVMLLGVSGMVFPLSADLIHEGVYMLLNYIINVAMLMSRIPYGKVAAFMSSGQLVWSYVLLGVVLFMLRNKQKQSKS